MLVLTGTTRPVLTRLCWYKTTCSTGSQRVSTGVGRVCAWYILRYPLRACYALSVAALANGAIGLCVVRALIQAICRRACYAMSGTDVVRFRAETSAEWVTPASRVHCASKGTIALRPGQPMSGTDIAYAATHVAYTVSGTEIAYGGRWRRMARARNAKTEAKAGQGGFDATLIPFLFFLRGQGGYGTTLFPFRCVPFRFEPLGCEIKYAMPERGQGG
eukprot:3940331-Rhodomonas_salina.2